MMGAPKVHRIVAGAFVTLLAATPCFAARTPTDIELQAEYCLAATVAEAKVIQGVHDKYPNVPKSDLDRSVERDSLERFQRLTAYLTPRRLEIDPLAMRLAHNRGLQDVQRAMVEIPDCVETCEYAELDKNKEERCKSSCDGQLFKDSCESSCAFDAFSERRMAVEKNKERCEASCGGVNPKDITERLQRCNSVNWLPF